MSGIARNAATAAAWGDRPPTRQVKIKKWTPLRSRSLLGFLDIELRSGMISLDWRLMMGKNGLWVAAPAQKQLDRDGQPRLDANGRPVYRALIEFRNRRIAERFNAAVLDALRREDPYALAGQASS